MTFKSKMADKPDRVFLAKKAEIYLETNLKNNKLKKYINMDILLTNQEGFLWLRLQKSARNDRLLIVLKVFLL